MPGSAAAAMAMKRKRNAEKNKDKDAGPRAAPVLEEEKSEEQAEKEMQKALAAKAKSKKNALKFMQEMAMYIFWVLCFTGTIYMTREGTQSYQFANLFQSWLIDNDGWLDSLKTVDDFWSFTRSGVSKVLGDDLYKVIGDDFGSSRAGSFLYGNRRIGQLRLRQVRVPSQQCSKTFLQNILGPSDPEYATIRCYPEFSSSLNLETKFTKESQGNDFIPDLEKMPWFKFHGKKEINEMSEFGGMFETYPGDGYVLDIDKTSTDSSGNLILTIIPVDPPRKPMNVTLNEVINSKWIDVKTRAVFFDFTFFNPNINLFLVVRITVEFLPSGIVALYPTFRIVNPFRFKMGTLKDMITMGMFGVSGGLALFYMQEEYRMLVKGPSKYIKSAWSMMAFINVNLMGLVVYFYLTNYMQTTNIFGDKEGEVYQGDLQRLGFSLDQEKNFEGLVVIIMWLRLYKYCSISRSLSTLTRTIGKSVSKLIQIVFLILLPLLGFMCGMLLILGTNTFNFSSFQNSAYTLFRALLGDFDYSEWASNRYLGPMCLVVWVLFTSVLILNIIVAVLCDAYAAVTIENEEFEAKGIKSVMDIFIESGLLGGRMSKMLNKKAGQAQDMEAALAAIDADGDGMTDLGELEAWMKATGAESILGMSAMEVMARYDSDGSGQLDDDEMQEIKDWVAREREAAEAAALRDATAVTDMDYDNDKKSGAIDAKAVMAMVQQSGGGMSLAMEEKILNIENNVMDIKEKMIKLLAKIDSMSTMGVAMGGGAAGDAAAARLPGATGAGSPAKQTNLKQEGGKLVASKLLVQEEG